MLREAYKILQLVRTPCVGEQAPCVYVDLDHDMDTGSPDDIQSTKKWPPPSVEHPKFHATDRFHARNTMIYDVGKGVSCFP